MTNLLDAYISGASGNSAAQPMNITKPKTDRKKLTAASVIGSAAGITAATALIYAAAKKKVPGLKFKNINYDEKDAFIIGAASIAGGLAGGLSVDKDKKNREIKLREATQQLVGATACPVGVLAAANKLLDKLGNKNVLVKAAVTIGSLVTGMHIGNNVVNIINNKIFKGEMKHEVHPEDYFVHTDDICLTANMIMKDIPSVSKITSGLLPASFLIAGTKTGMQTVSDIGPDIVFENSKNPE